MADPRLSSNAGTPDIQSRDADLEAVAEAGLANQRVMLGHPMGLFLLFVVEMWERFSYYGMRALLVLYLVAQLNPAPDKNGFMNPGRGWTEPQAYSLYGLYTGLAYLLPIVGGFIADKLLGTHRSMLLGGSMIALGHIVLGISGIGDMAHSALGMSVFIAGLALIVLGTGYFKPTVSVMVGQLYRPGDSRRDGGFSIFYMGINVGAFICAFICGTLGEQVGWHWGFGSAAVGMILGLVVYIFGKPILLKGIGSPPAGKPNYTTPLAVLTLVLAAAVGAAYHAGVFDILGDGMKWLTTRPGAAVWLPLAIIGATVAGCGYFISIQKPEDRGIVFCIFTFILFNAFFWLAFEQAGSTLNVFAKESTDRMIGTYEVPATWFQSINALLIILFAPVFAAIWAKMGNRNPTQPVKISLGLIFLGIGYICMVMGANGAVNGVKVSMLFLVGTYFFHTMGELCLSPTGLSFVTKAAPARFVSFLMGLWFLSSFVANYGGGLVATYVERIEKGEIVLPWSSWFADGSRAPFFMLFVVTSLGAGVVILLMTPFLKGLMGSKVNA